MDPGRIRGFDPLFRRSKNFSFAFDHGPVRFFYPFPAFVPIHGIITTAYSSDFTGAFPFHEGFQRLHILQRALRRHVPAVQKSMDIHLGQTHFPRHIDQRFQVLDMAMHPAVTQKSHKVQRTFFLPGVLHRFK